MTQRGGGKPKPRKPASLASKAREMRGAMTREEIAAKLGVSTGWVSNAWAAGERKARRSAAAGAPRAEGASARVEAPAPVADAATGQPGGSAAVADLTVAELRTMVQQQTAALERMQGVAEDEGDLTAFASLARVVAGNTSLLASKLKVQEREDPEAAPDMQDAARRAREKMHELLDRALAGGGGGE